MPPPVPPQQQKVIPSGQKKGYSAVGDQYGLLGLSLAGSDPLQGGPSNEFMKLLLNGFEISSLGLSLAQPEPLHPMFSSPWSEAPSKVQPEYRLPQCYTVSPPPLRFVMFQKFQLETLFYVFYSMPRDVLQLAAAQELTNRNWKFHKELRMWITPVPGVEPVKLRPGCERGSYFVWNPEAWAKEKRDLVLSYADIEDKAVQQQAGGAPPGQPPAAPQQGAPGGVPPHA